MTPLINHSQLKSLMASPRGVWLQSSVGRKLLTGVTGLGLALFVVVHLLGNLLLFAGSDAFNQYGRRLATLGPLLYAIELALLGFVILHALLGVHIYMKSRRSRPTRYAHYASVGEPSVQSLSSRSMVFTGLALGIFLWVHVQDFRFGPDYRVAIAGVEMRDLARLVFETFQSPVYTCGYVAIMVLLGLHLRHGFWSALQSLGAMSARLKPAIYGLGSLLAVLLAVGYGLLPLAIYLGWIGHA